MNQCYTVIRFAHIRLKYYMIRVHNWLHQERGKTSMLPPTSLSAVWNVYYYVVHWHNSARIQNTISREKHQHIYKGKGTYLLLGNQHCKFNQCFISHQIVQCFLFCIRFFLFEWVVKLKIWCYLIIGFNFTYFPRLWCARLVMVQCQCAWVFRTGTFCSNVACHSRMATWDDQLPTTRQLHRHMERLELRYQRTNTHIHADGYITQDISGPGSGVTL